jgi:predicted rRNA methylase YqxC with S4 and FtsJ domains
VRDEQVRADAIARTLNEAVALGFEKRAQADAVIAGPEGNLEHFVWLHRP